MFPVERIITSGTWTETRGCGARVWPAPALAASPPSEGGGWGDGLAGASRGGQSVIGRGRGRCGELLRFYLRQSRPWRTANRCKQDQRTGKAKLNKSRGTCFHN